MAEFITEVRTGIPDVTGAPVTQHESAKRMIEGFILVALLTALIVLIIVYWEFKKPLVTLLIFANLLITFIWLTAFMYLKGIQINLANFFALPVLIGSGIDHGIHILHRYNESGSIKDLFTSTVPAVILSCLTTIFGFASLSMVRHNGLASFGLIMAVGTLLIMLSSVVLLPCMMAIWQRQKKTP